jgi:hypothetical protein
MPCGCGGGNKSHIKNARLATATRVSPPPPMSAAPISNNLSPGFGMTELPSPPVNEADRRRIQKLRQDAKIRALGKI